MRIAIDPPVRRPLTPNEQRVLGLLREGLEPLEIARQLHMALQISNLANRHDVPPDTVMGLIASIREKGWEIPENNKEENNMSRGQKTPVEKVHEISILKDEGKTHLSTVGKVCAQLNKAETKKEPAPSENGTSTQEKTFNNSIVPEIPADVNPCDEISDEDFCCEVMGDTDMEAYLTDRERFFAAKKRVIPNAVKEACLRMREDELSKIDALLNEVNFRRERVGELEKFLEVQQ